MVRAIIGAAGCASASVAVSGAAAGRSSVSLIAMLLVGLVGAAPALIIGGLLYGMARDRADRG